MAREFRRWTYIDDSRVLQCSTSDGAWVWLDVAIFDLAVPNPVVDEIVEKLNRD